MEYLPELDYSKIKVVSSVKELFNDSYLHIIAIPEDERNRGEDNVASRLAEIFFSQLKVNNNIPLIIFESAFIPGHIEKYFVERLKHHKIQASKNYYMGVMFRKDWNIEAFISNRDKLAAAGYDDKSLQVIKELAAYLGVSIIPFDNIKEAEIYINSSNVIQAMLNDSMRQLAMGYHSVNMKKVSELLFKNITLDGCVLNIGTGGTRMMLATDFLIEGSDNPQNLTLFKEFQDINISSVLSYAEYIVRHSYRSVSILGITYSGNQKDLTLSPSVTLADYLIKNSVKVLLNEPFCSKQEIKKLVKGAEVVDFPGEVFSSDVLVIASDHNHYKYITQSKIDSLKKNVKLIIDNYGTWSAFNFGNKIKYHQVGDGSLNLLK
jgi:UDP-N-acetyl-D-mannosaminuronate dehydrogenase